MAGRIYFLTSLCVLRINCVVSLQQGGLYQTGDVIIGGLFPIHLRLIDDKCTTLRPEGLIWSEAMKLAIDTINGDASFLPNITLGYNIQDTCSTEQAAISPAAEFSFTNTLIFDQRYKSAVNACVDQATRINTTRSPVIAALGGEDSRVSVNIANVLQLNNIPQISYGSTSSQLSDTGKFSTFFRTVPSDEFQSLAMAHLASHYDWTCVALIGTDDVYGRSGIDSFVEAAKNKRVCVAAREFFDVHVHGSTVQIREIVKKLKGMSHVEVIVLYSLSAQAVNIFEESLRQNMIDKTWIASDGWAESAYIRQKRFIPIIQGTVGFEFRDVYFDALGHYFRNFSIHSHRNEWWDEFLVSVFNCSPNGGPNATVPSCTGNETITEDLYQDELHNPITAYVRDAVYAVAHALNSSCHNSNCNNVTAITPEAMVKALRNTVFKGLTGLIDFAKQEKQARYDVINLQIDNNGNFDVVNVGKWDNQILQMNDDAIQWHNNKTPHSSCGGICGKGTHKSATIQCMWECVPCSGDSFNDVEGSTTCKKCPDGSIYEANHTGCTEVPPLYIKWKDPWGIGLLTVNCICIVVTSLILGILLKHSHTPIVRETGGFLNIALLMVILLSFGFNFVLLSKPSNLRCQLLTISFYIVYTNGVVLFLLKIFVIRCSLETEVELIVITVPVGQPSTLEQKKVKSMWKVYLGGVIASLIPIILTISWIFVADIRNAKRIVSRNIVYCYCASSNSTLGLFFRYLNIIYLFSLTVFATVYAYRTKNISQLQKFRETKHLSYALTVFLFTLMTFYPGWALIQGPVLQVFACSTNIIAASGVILCSYGPKLHLLLMFPSLNSSLHIHPVRKSINSAALGIGLTLINTGKGRSATFMMEDTTTQSQSQTEPQTSTHTSIA